jgi:glutamate dehydrogenase
MVKLGYVTRHRDSLPDDDALNERVAKKLGLVRPELSVLIAAAKRWMKLSMLETTIPDHPLLADELLRYFPKTLQSTYREQIYKHPLGRNIIATQLTNYLVNTTGVTFLHRMCAQYSVSPEIVIRCSVAAQYILGAQKVHDTLWVLDTPSDNDFFCTCWTYTSGAVREATSWLLKTHGATLSLQEMIDLYHRRFQTLIDHADDIFEPKESVSYSSLRAHAHERNVEESSARRLALFPDTLRIFEMLWASRESAQSIPTVARVYELVVNALNLNEVFLLESKIETTSKWESELLSHSFDDIRRGISTTVIELIAHSISDTSTVHTAITQSENYEQFNATLSEISDSSPPVTSIAVLARQIVGFRPKVLVVPAAER